MASGETIIFDGDTGIIVSEACEVELGAHEVELEAEHIPVEHIETVPAENIITIPVDTIDNVQTVETVEIECDHHGQAMIALQPLTDQEEIVLQTREEVVGDDDDFGGTYIIDSDTVPVPNSDVYEDSLAISGKKKKGKKASRTRVLASGELSFDDKSTRKWEQKQVQIKTLEGEFSVTMWASGKSRIFYIICIKYVSRLLFLRFLKIFYVAIDFPFSPLCCIGSVPLEIFPLPCALTST